MKEKFLRWNTLLGQYIKRDWLKIGFWILGVGLFSAAFVPAFQEIAKGDGLQGMFETLQNPAMTSMVGPTPIESANDYTLGAMYAHEMLLFCGLFAMIIAALHVISHTRKEEELGLTELIRSFQVGRQANALATVMQVLLINILLVLLIAGVMISFGADTITAEGSFLFAASIGAAGLIGAGIALMMAQIMPTSTASTGTTLGIIGLLYIIRASTDAANADFSMLNPMGWTYLTYPFTENNWLPLVYALALSLLLVLLAFVLEGARDMGAGYLPQRKGKEKASKWLLSIPGLFLKLNKATIISWLIAFLVLGAAYGSIYGDMQTFLESNDVVEQMFTQSGSTIEESFTGTIMMVLIGLVSLLPIAIINKLFAEESRGHLSQLLATKVTRAQLYWSSLGIAVLAGVLSILFTAGSLGGTALTSMENSQELSMKDFLAAGYNFLPSVLFFIGLASLALGWTPKLGKIVYIYLIYSFMLSYFEGVLDLPDWFLKTAVQSWIPQMPMESFSVTPFVVITGGSMVCMIMGYAGYRGRDMVEG
ncbi:MAG TPA: tetronasin resistance protein [Pseudogracilibacillus sp.]|nr:tetronasin resistance protein [Pseudogracilibacillus sp.]